MTRYIRFPSRSELFPVSREQSCVFCGSDDWAWMYVLLQVPDWVARLSWTANWFVVTCASCNAAFEADDASTLAAAWDRLGEPVPSDVEELMAVLRSRQSEPPVERRLAIAAP